jgi:hypothetical protein
MSIRDTLKKSRAKVHEMAISTGTVYVRSFNGAQRQLWIDVSKSLDHNIPLHTVAALGLCEQDGSMLFDCSTEKGRMLANVELQEVDAEDLQAICLKLMSVSGVSRDAVGEAEKKSEASQSE